MRGLRIGFRRNLKLAAAQSSYALSGQAASFTVGGGGGFVDALTDWNARKSAAGVTFSCDFSGAADFTLASVNGGTGRVFALGMSPTETAKVTKDTTDGITNGCCLKILKPASEGTGSAEWLFPLSSSFTSNSDSFGLGVPFWIQFRFKIPASRLVKSNVNPGGQYAWKWMNICQYSPTNTASQSFANVGSQIVLQDTDQLGVPQAYHRDFGGNYPAFLGGGTESSPAGIFKTVQNVVDRGSGSHEFRYCEVPGPDFDTASPGCYFWPTDEWMTFQIRIKPANYSGGPGNEFDMWFARAGATSWTHLIHEVDFSLGSPNENGGGFTGINGGHFLTYESQRINSTVDTYHKYDQVLVSLNEPAIPRDSGIGAGTGTSPSWYQSMVAGRWSQIPDSKLQNCVDFEKSKTPPFTSGSFGNDGSWNCITAYGGGVQGTGYIYGGATRYDGPFFFQKGGGHQIGAQAPYFLPFLYDTASGVNKWKRYRASVVSGGEYIAATTGVAFDGSGNPVANQTYDSLSYIAADNAILQMGMTFCHTSDASYLNVGKSLKINCNQISPDSNNPYSTVADPPFGTGCGASAWEAPNGSNGAKGTIWFQGQGDGKFSSYDVAANTYGSVYSLSYAAASQPTMACDQNRGILCIVGQVSINGGAYGFGIGMLRTSNPAGDWYSYINHNGAAPMGMMVQDQSGTPDAGTPTPGDSTGNDATILWNPDLDCFVVWYGGKTLWKLVPPTTNPYKNGNRWTWIPITSAVGDDPSPSNIPGSTGFGGLAQGTYQRFGYISDSRCRGYFLLHGVNENMYFWKV